MTVLSNERVRIPVCRAEATRASMQDDHARKEKQHLERHSKSMSDHHEREKQHVAALASLRETMAKAQAE